MNLEAVFNEMAANKDGNIRKEAISPDHVVQKHIITDNIAHLMDEASKWLTGNTFRTNHYCSLYSVRGLERRELGGSHRCPGRLWERFL